MTERWATFDCYGTLIDWMGGIRTALARTFPDRDASALLRRFHEIEPLVQAGRAISYRQVLTESDRKSTRLNSSHVSESRMPSSA